MDSHLSLYTTKHICQKIAGMTPRMLIDLVEKKFIVPAMPSSGTGEHRLYSKDNLLEIMVAIFLRGTRSSYMVTAVLSFLKISVHKKEIEQVQYIVLRKSSNKVPPSINLLKKEDDLSKHLLFSRRETESYSGSILPGPTDVVDSYGYLVIDVGGMQEFINKNF
jgi:hypothetical protein